MGPRLVVQPLIPSHTKFYRNAKAFTYILALSNMFNRSQQQKTHTVCSNRKHPLLWLLCSHQSLNCTARNFCSALHAYLFRFSGKSCDLLTSLPFVYTFREPPHKSHNYAMWRPPTPPPDRNGIGSKLTLESESTSASINKSNKQWYLTFSVLNYHYQEWY